MTNLTKRVQAEFMPNTTGENKAFNYGMECYCTGNPIQPYTNKKRNQAWKDGWKHAVSLDR